jgi:predicted DCC family thiol-disulfide oxidoreductase YuxK
LPYAFYETFSPNVVDQREWSGDVGLNSELMGVAPRAPLILFDGVCNLCNGWVRFVVRRDPAGVFRFAAQQSPAGQALIEERMRGAVELSSVILIVDDAAYTESDAVLQILARLGRPWSWVVFLRFIPRRVRDVCYRFIARHRYRWFGKTELCQIPSPEIRSRFIE